MWLKIQRLKKLEVFNSLKLPIEDTAEATTEILMEVLIKLISETELARIELIQIKLIQMELV